MKANNKLKQLMVTIAAIGLFLIITLLASYKVFPSNGIITFNDSAFFHDWRGSLDSIATTLSPNYLGQDQSSALFNYIPKSISILVLSIFKLSNAQIAYILFFGLFFLASLSYFFIFRRISGNYFFGILAGMFAVLNNLTIEHLAFGGAFYYFLGLIAFALIFYTFWSINKNKTPTLLNIIYLIIISLLIIHPFYFFIYLLLLIMFFIFLIIRNRNFTKNFIILSIIFLGAILVNFYWIFPFFHSLIYQSAEAIYNNNVDVVFGGFLKVVSYKNSINFFQYFNFFSENFHQTTLHYFFYSGILFSMIGSLFFIKNKTHRKFLLFILTAYFVFSNLALGPVSMLSGQLWIWLWDNFSFFKFFRAFSRFLIVIIPIYLIYFAVFTEEWKHKCKNYIFLLISLIVLLLNISVLSGDLKGNILATKIPSEYKVLNSILSSDNRDGNVIAFPIAGYEGYSWGVNRNTSIMVQDYYLKDYMFDKPILYNRGALNLDQQNKIFSETLAFDNFDRQKMDENLLKMNVNYILIQKDIIDVEGMKKINYESYDKYFRSNTKYSLIESNEYFNLYSYNVRLKNTIESDNDNNIIFQRVNSTKYKIYLKYLKNSESLSLLQRFNENWGIYLEKNPSKNWCGELNNLNKCSGNQQFIQINDLSYLFKKNISESSHQTIYEYANKWVVDADYIKKNFSSDYYKINKDGSIDIEITIIYRSQTYFYLGIIITSVSILILVAILFLNLKRNSNIAVISKQKVHPDWF